MPIIINSHYNHNYLFSGQQKGAGFNLPMSHFSSNFSLMLIIILKLLKECVLVGWKALKTTNHEFSLLVQGSDWIAAVGPASKTDGRRV